LDRAAWGPSTKAWDDTLGRPVALKLLLEALTVDEKHRSRLLREARTAAAVQHRSIVSIYEVGVHEGHVFIAMEYVQGQSLRDRLQGEPMPLPEALKVGADIATGLARAHASSIVHRDLKPENVLLDEDGEVRILDFGLAKSFDSAEGIAGGAAAADTALTSAGAVMGTPAYMAPEQARAGEVGFRADLFSLGVMLYEMLCGKRPFEGSTTAEVIAAVLRDTPLPLYERAPELPRELTDLVAECLEKEPARRQANAAEVASRLKAIGSLAVSARGAAAFTPTRSASVHARLADQGPVVPTSTIAVDTASGDQPGEVSIEPMATLAKPVVSGSRTMRAVAGALLLSTAGGAALYWGKGAGEGAAAPAPSPLSAPHAVIACPPLVADGVPSADRTYGAAAAALVCDYLALVQGADEKLTRVPAELLALPKQPKDDFPERPFEERTARQRAIEVARTHAGWVDGEAHFDGERHRLKLQLRGTQGPVGEPVEAEHPQLVRAVWAAVDGWLKAGHLRQEEPQAEIVEVSGCRTLECLRLGAFATLLSTSDPDTERLCRETKGVNPLAALQLGECAVDERKALSQIAEPLRQVRQALRDSEAADAPTNRSRAERLERLRSREKPSDAVLRDLMNVEAILRARGGDAATALALSSQVTGRWPRDCGSRLTASMLGMATTRQSALRALVAWCPYLGLGYENYWATTSDRLAALRLGYVLAPWSSLGHLFGHELLHVGKPEEAKLVASRYLVGPARHRLIGRYLMGTVELFDGKPAASLGWFLPSIESPEWSRKGNEVWQVVLYGLIRAAELTGRGAEVADRLIEELLMSSPPRLPKDAFRLPAAMLCAHASRGNAKRCAKRVSELGSSGYLGDFGMPVDRYLEGAEEYAAGDFTAAASAWRPLVEINLFTASLRSEAFDNAGDSELGSRVDRIIIERGTPGLAWLREARRARRRGDHDEARRIAKRFLDTFGTSDADVPALEEARTLLAALGKQ
jgi:eukaryotic-like serine/threonine-protein kinase